MSDPLSFDSVSPRFGLPFLFSGQAQKEFFVNEAFAKIDGLLHGTVLGSAASEPSSPVEGDAWLVGSTPTGTWIGHANEVAMRQGGEWRFASPIEGMSLFNTGAGQTLRWLSGSWRSPSEPASPSGGSVVDVQARDAINALIVALRNSGVFPI